MNVPTQVSTKVCTYVHIHLINKKRFLHRGCSLSLSNFPNFIEFKVKAKSHFSFTKTIKWRILVNLFQGNARRDVNMLWCFYVLTFVAKCRVLALYCLTSEFDYLMKKIMSLKLIQNQTDLYRQKNFVLLEL